jgi:hypothetical protein
MMLSSGHRKPGRVLGVRPGCGLPAAMVTRELLIDGEARALRQDPIRHHSLSFENPSISPLNTSFLLWTHSRPVSRTLSEAFL